MTSAEMRVRVLVLVLVLAQAAGEVVILSPRMRRLLLGLVPALPLG